jgi:hypothetical protein
MRSIATRITRRFLRWLDPTTFYNSDASLEIDRLTVENERLQRLLAEAPR